MAEAKLSAVGEAALRYAAMGWAVFPVHTANAGACSCGRGSACPSPAKHPRIENGLLAASKDPAQVAQWWKKWPNANIGVATGRISGFWVLDIDAKHNGEESLSSLVGKQGKLPDTVEALTGGGGRHLLFEAKTLVQSSVSRVGPGIDVRGDGGYIVAPPSRHISGKTYEWEASSEPEEVRIAPAPGWLLQATEKPASAGPKLARPVLGEKVIAGGRNEFLFRQACKMRGAGFSEAVITAAIGELNAEMCNPPLDESEVKHLCKSSTRYDEAKVLTASTEWLQDLARSDKGVIKPTLGNATLILENDGLLCGRIHMDEFRNRVFTSDSLPFKEQAGAWSDTDAIECAVWCEAQYGVAYKVPTIHDAVAAVAKRHAVHELRDYLARVGQEWDGVERVPQFFEDHFGAAPGEYERAVSKNFLVSCVARILSPGCQCDHMPVIEGEQGIGKSQSLRALAGDDWYMEVSQEWGSKDFFMSLRGKWICEVGELSAIRRSQIERVKQILTSTHDVYRPAYGRIAEEFPRQSVFAGTTNERNYLVDPTGNRRFWPIRAGTANPAGIRAMRDQIWGEAVVRFRRGEGWWVVPGDTARLQQDERYDEDSWADVILPWASSREKMRMVDLLSDAVGIEVAKHSRADQMRASNVLKRAGFEVVVTRSGQKTERFWRKKA